MSHNAEFVIYNNDSFEPEQIFSERRGQWKAATQSQEFFRTLQRYYSNAYMDAEKQDAINVYVKCLVTKFSVLPI